MIGAQLCVQARLAAALAVLVLAGCGAVAPVPPARSSHLTGPIRPLDSFLTVTTSAAVVRDGQHSSIDLIRYPVETLQLRSVHGGRVIASLLHTLGHVDAVMTRSGSVIAVEDYGCRLLVLRIDPRTARAALIRVLPESADDVALSPDGGELAYLTYPAATPQPCIPDRQPAAPVPERTNLGGRFLPNVVAVVNLHSGAVVRGATSDPGDPPTAPAWSPDGTRIAVAYLQGASVVLLSAAHPDFTAAPQIRSPRGCGYATVAWTVTGLVAVAGCGQNEPDLSPQSLVQLSLTGQQTASWRLPACIDGIQEFTDPTASHVLVEADIGYGDGPPCGLQRPVGVAYSVRVAVIGGRKLATIATFRVVNTQLEVTGW